MVLLIQREIIVIWVDYLVDAKPSVHLNLDHKIHNLLIYSVECMDYKILDFPLSYYQIEMQILHLAHLDSMICPSHVSSSNFFHA